MQQIAHLQFWVGIKHDVLIWALDVFSPADEPCHSVIMSNFLPVVPSRWYGDTRVSARARTSAIQYDMLIWTCFVKKHKTSLWFYTFKQFVYQKLTAFLWVRISLFCIEQQGHMERTETKVVLNYTLTSQSHSHLLQLMMTSSGWILFFSMPCLGCSPLPRNNPGGSILKLPMRSLWWSRRQ